MDAIERVGGKVRGVVLNAVDLDDYAQNYYYGYHTYNYGSEPREIADEPVRTLTAGEG